MSDRCTFYRTAVILYISPPYILILQNLNVTTISFQDIISLLELITNCPFLVNFCNLYDQENQTPDKDYEYEIQQNKIEIEKLKQEIEELKQEITRISTNKSEAQSLKFPLITTKPTDYESDLLIACQKGKLESVQWLIEKEKVDKNFQHEGDASIPIQVAASFGHLSIVQYLIENQNVDVDMKGALECTPLHSACLCGALPLVEYLVSKGANIDAKNMNGWTPLHYASQQNYIDIVKYLVSKGADKYAKNNEKDTPSYYTNREDIKQILK